MHTEELAKAIVRLIDDKESRGESLSEEDKLLLADIAKEFPGMTQRTDNRAFHKWIWSVMVPGEASVAKMTEELMELRAAAMACFSSETESEEMKEILDDKAQELSNLKHRVCDAMLADKELCESLYRKWQELCRTPQSSIGVSSQMEVSS